MSKPQPKAGQLVSRFAGRERGKPIQVQTQKVKLPDGTPGHASVLSLADAEVPERSYLGEMCGIAYENYTVKVMFAQPKIGGAGLRSLLILSMTPSAAAQFVRSIDEMKDPSLWEIAKNAEIVEESLMSMPSQEPEQTASLVSNLGAIAIHGRETTIDFYHANAFSHLHLQATKTELYLEPIVRVNTRTSLLLSLANTLKKMRSGFPADAALPGEVL